jgi:hypothetical protein
VPGPAVAAERPRWSEVGSPAGVGHRVVAPGIGYRAWGPLTRRRPVADGLGATSVAFPAISTGIYGFPPDDAAVATLRAARTSVAEVLLVAFDDATLRRYQRELTG